VINHFRTFLLNQPVSFFVNALVNEYIEDSFVQRDASPAVREVYRCLFGTEPDGTLLNYRFRQFSTLIRSVRMEGHVTRFDSRITYDFTDAQPFIDPIFTTVTQPETGLTVTVDSDGYHGDTVRHLLAVKCDTGSIVPIDEISYGFTVTGAYTAEISTLGMKLFAEQDGMWTIDHRVKPARSLEKIIDDSNDLSASILHGIFDPIEPITPEYRKAYVTVTDKIYRFVALLFATAVAIEQSPVFVPYPNI
jgi:hypothetical protein